MGKKKDKKDKKSNKKSEVEDEKEEAEKEEAEEEDDVGMQPYPTYGREDSELEPTAPYGDVYTAPPEPQPTVPPEPQHTVPRETAHTTPALVHRTATPEPHRTAPTEPHQRAPLDAHYTDQHPAHVHYTRTERIPQNPNTSEEYMVRPSGHDGYKVERSPPRDHISHTQKAQSTPSGRSGGGAQIKNVNVAIEEGAVTIRLDSGHGTPQVTRIPYESAHSNAYPSGQSSNYGGAYGRSQQCYSGGGVQGYGRAAPDKSFDFPRGVQAVRGNSRANTTSTRGYDRVNNYPRTYVPYYNYGAPPAQACPTYGVARIPQNPPLTNYGRGSYFIPPSQPSQTTNNLNYTPQNYPTSTQYQQQMPQESERTPIICILPCEMWNKLKE